MEPRPTIAHAAEADRCVAVAASMSPTRMNLKLAAMPLPGSAACLLTKTRQPRATVRLVVIAYAVSILITWQFLITEGFVG